MFTRQGEHRSRTCGIDIGQEYFTYANGTGSLEHSIDVFRELNTVEMAMGVY